MHCNHSLSNQLKTTPKSLLSAPQPPVRRGGKQPYLNYGEAKFAYHLTIKKLYKIGKLQKANFGQNVEFESAYQVDTLLQ